MTAFKNFARRIANRGFACALAVHSRRYESPPGPLLIVAPHPDDETLGCGAAIASHLHQGGAVHVVFLTDGEGSHDGHPNLTRDKLRRLRRVEAQDALALLGLRTTESNPVFLQAPDGQLDRLPPALREHLIRTLAEKIRAVAPAAIFAPYSHGGSTEHTAAFALTGEACAAAGGGVLLEYPIWAWWNAFRLRPQLRPGADNLRLPLQPWRDLKRRALACHRTQVVAMPPWSDAALPAAIADACCGANEFFFRRRITSSTV